MLRCLLLSLLNVPVGTKRIMVSTFYWQVKQYEYICYTVQIRHSQFRYLDEIILRQCITTYLHIGCSMMQRVLSCITQCKVYLRPFIQILFYFEPMVVFPQFAYLWIYKSGLAACRSRACAAQWRRLVD